MTASITFNSVSSIIHDADDLLEHRARLEIFYPTMDKQTASEPTRVVTFVNNGTRRCRIKQKRENGHETSKN